MTERDIFIGALQKGDPGERGAYLAEACGADAALRGRVEGLLEVFDRAGSFLEEPAGPPAGTGAYTPSDAGAPALTPGPEAGALIAGRYKLLEVIGEGGMGTVWMAQQNEPVRRKVAVKLIKPGMDTRQVLARFEAERQALALMDHPNIAKVFDGGATAEGRPYFVMELVKGVPITKYCDDHKLNPRERLGLFVPVCWAVQHAHQKGIVHRDLKPSNVLVAPYDGRPVPKVIDFGVAKAAGQPLTEKTLFTGLGAVVGTPEYMSPEQAELNNQDVDTRSDVYSLGVLLYELLTGSTPLTRKRVKEAALLEVLRVIREEEAPRPSTRLSESKEALASISAQRQMEPAKLTKLVKGELDWIVMKTLEKDRNRRYETANGLAMDVQRYLADEPVQACPPSAGYRFRKFARRNKAALGVTALLGVMLLAAVGAVTGSIGWAARDRDARQAAIELEAKLPLKEAERLLGQGKYPAALSAAKRAEGILAGGGSDEFRERVGKMRKDLEMVLRLEGLRFERHVVNTGTENDPRSEATYAKVFRDYGIDVQALPPQEAAERIRARPIRLELVLGLDDWLLVGSWKADQDSWKALLALARAADPDPWRNRLRETLEPQKRKAVLRELAALDNARNLATSNLFLLNHSPTVKDAPELVESVFRQARQHNPGDFWINVGLAYSLQNLNPPQTDESIRFYSVALALRPDSHWVLCNLGALLSRKGQLDEAIACNKEAIRLKPDFASAHNSLGVALSKKGKLDEAIASYRKAIELNPTIAGYHYNLGAALKQVGKLDEAIVWLKKAIEFDPTCDGAYVSLGNALKDQGKLDEAIACHKQAIALEPNGARHHYNLGCALHYRKNLGEAIAAYRKAIELDPKHAFAHCNLGHALQAQGKLDEAIVCYEKAIELTPDDAVLWSCRGSACCALKQYDKAIADYSKAIELKPAYAEAWQQRDRVYQILKQDEKAVAAYSKAIDRNPDHALAWYYRGAAHASLKQYDKALADFAKAIELKPDLADAWQQQHQVYGVLKQCDRAVADYSRAIDRKPDNEVAWAYRAAAYRCLKQYDKALADYSKAIELKPDYAEAWRFRHQVYGILKQYDRAVAAYSKAIVLKPDNAWAWYYRGDAHESLEQYDRTIADFLKVIQLKPSDFFYAIPRQQLAWLLANCPDPKFRNAARAVELAKTAVEYNPKDWGSWQTLGAAHYRAGDWKAALAALHTSMELRKGGDGLDGFFVAMAHWKQGDKVEARKWHDRAVAWMDKNEPKNQQLRRFRAEAAELMRAGGGVEVAPLPRQKP